MQDIDLAGALPMAYDAFISYSHSADGRLAPALQQALKHLAKPWYRLHALAVFRDETDLSAVPDLTAAIRAALAGSRYFVYLASPSAAASRWVGEEIETWKRRNLPDKLLIAVTEGDIEWSAAAGDFDWARSTALHPGLKGVFSKEPLWVDLRWAGDDSSLSPRDPRFQRATAMLAAPMHGKTLDELVGEDVRQHRRTRWWLGAGMTTVTLLLVLFIGATVIASRFNTQLQSKLDLVEQTLPFFRVGPESNGNGDNEEALPAWRRTWNSLRASLFAPTLAETWVSLDMLAPRLALQADCVDSRKESVGGGFDCPSKATDFDGEGLRSDIPGLAAMADTLVAAARTGRAQALLENSDPARYESEDNDPDAGADSDLQELLMQADIVLTDRARSALPETLVAGGRSSHFESRRHFQLWRQPVRKAAVDAELVLLRFSDTAFCGSGVCSNPTIGFLRVGSVHVLVFAQVIWGDIALYDAGPGNMPQIFSIGRSQSGAQQQHRAVTRAAFDAQCLCYQPYLTGRITSFEPSADQQMPTDLKAALAGLEQSRSLRSRDAAASSPGGLQAPSPTTPPPPVTIEEIEGIYELAPDSSVNPDANRRYGKGRLEVRRLESDRVLLLLACGWRDSPRSSCWEWWVLEWRDGALFGIEGRVAPLSAVIFDRQSRSLTVRSGSGASPPTDVFVPAQTRETTDPDLKRRMGAAVNSWSRTAKDLDEPGTEFSVKVELIRIDAKPTQRR